MPYDDPDASDPMMLVGVELPADLESFAVICRVFAEEFARLGFDEDAVMALFRDPFYAGAHRAYQALGEPAVRGMVREAAGIWSRVRTVERTPDPKSQADEQERSHA
ncbi:MAG: hypothetical protein U1E76_16645 [Planctomycetota bacterium]